MRRKPERLFAKSVREVRTGSRQCSQNQKMKKLEEHLFRNGVYTYAVLDGAAVPDLPRKLFEMKQPNVCLYRGELSPDIVYVAPYLVQMFPGQEFTTWLLQNFRRKNWGIFAQSSKSMVTMRTHFRSFLTVYDETGKPLLFRFYDPRVLSIYLPTCNGGELTTFFGSVTCYFAENENADRFDRFEFANGELLTTPLEIFPPRAVGY